MSIRVRLTLWHVLLLCLGLALFAAAVVWQTDHAAVAAFDQDLRQRATDVRGDLSLGAHITLRQDMDESGGQPGDTTLLVRVLDARGAVVVRQGPVIRGVPSGLLDETRAGLYTRDVASDRHVHLYVLPVTHHGRLAATIQVLATTRQVELARHQLLAAMAVAGGLIVAAAALSGLFLADRALRPVDRITRLAARIGAGDLHRRVETEVRHGASRRPRADEVGRLARTFDGMLARLEAADTQRRRLAADVAHELGTPITTIASSAEIALRQTRSGEDYRATLRQVLDESRRMGRLVDDLLLLARADAGQLPMERELVELDDVCRQAILAAQPLAAAHGVSLTGTLPAGALLVWGDAGRLGQVARNLLDNAIRYTPPGGKVALDLRADERGAYGGAHGGITLRVQDTGRGIAPEERERVFDRFYRAQDAAAASGDRGSGLGLAICKAIVEAHEGRIHVEGAADTGDDAALPGACIVITLPAVESQTPGATRYTEAGTLA